MITSAPQNSPPSIIYAKLFSTSGTCILFSRGYSFDLWCFVKLASLTYTCIRAIVKHERQCFITFPITEKRLENTTCSRVLLTKIVWKCDETLSRVFDVSSQSKLKPRSKPNPVPRVLVTFIQRQEWETRTSGIKRSAMTVFLDFRCYCASQAERFIPEVLVARSCRWIRVTRTLEMRLE